MGCIPEGAGRGVPAAHVRPDAGRGAGGLSNLGRSGDEGPTLPGISQIRKPRPECQRPCPLPSAVAASLHLLAPLHPLQRSSWRVVPAHTPPGLGRSLWTEVGPSLATVHTPQPSPRPVPAVVAQGSQAWPTALGALVHLYASMTRAFDALGGTHPCAFKLLLLGENGTSHLPGRVTCLHVTPKHISMDPHCKQPLCLLLCARR